LKDPWKSPSVGEFLLTRIILTPTSSGIRSSLTYILTFTFRSDRVIMKKFIGVLISILLIRQVPDQVRKDTSITIKEMGRTGNKSAFLVTNKLIQRVQL